MACMTWAFVAGCLPVASVAEMTVLVILEYRNDPKFSDRYAWANSTDQGLHCLPFRLHRLDTLLYGRAT